MASSSSTLPTLESVSPATLFNKGVSSSHRFPYQVPKFMLNVPLLDTNGENFEVWKEEITKVVRTFTGKEDYLSAPVEKPVDAMLDELVFSIITWSIDQKLQAAVKSTSSAYEALQTLMARIYAPNRDSHLATWRAIAAKGHPPEQPIEDYIKFIRERVEELDSGKFQWSKDSVLGILYQIGLPSSPFDAVNEIMSDRSKIFGSQPTLENIEETILEVEHSVKGETKKTARPSLLALPEDILKKIIGHISTNSTSSDKIKRWKWQCITEITGNGITPHWVYSNPSNIILRSIESFALVNRQLYRLCRPVIWKRLEFPTRMPSQMDHWTKTLLPKHGAFVQDLEIRLSDGWLTPLREGAPGPLYDNAIVLDPNGDQPNIPNFDPFAQPPCDISPANVQQILDHCSSVKRLKLKLPSENRSVHEVDYPNALETTLIPMVLRLAALRDLEIMNSSHYHFDDLCLNLIVTNLPLLESLSWDYVRRSDDYEATLLGENLCKHQSLSRLHINGSDIIDETWCYHAGPPKLTQLNILSCNHIASLADAHRIIHKFAPNVQRLGIALWRDYGAGGEDLEAENPPENAPEAGKSQILFDLPALTTLIFSERRSLDQLKSFVNCKALRSIICSSLPENGWPLIADLVCASTWPQLKFLDLGWSAEHNPADWDIVTSQLRLRRKCAECDIGLQMPWRYSF